jgi:hypothetical protein
MSSALLTLAGVVVGAVLGGAVQVFLRRREERQHLRVAARLMYDELVWCQGIVRGMLRDNQWLDVDRFRPRIDETWAEHRAILSGHLSYEEWFAVRGGVRAWEALQMIERESLPQDEPMAAVADRSVDEALAALVPILKAPRRS